MGSNRTNVGLKPARAELSRRSALTCSNRTNVGLKPDDAEPAVAAIVNAQIGPMWD